MSYYDEVDIDQAVKKLESIINEKEREFRQYKPFNLFRFKDSKTVGVLQQPSSGIGIVMNEGQQFVKSILGQLQYQASHNVYSFLAKVALGSFSVGLTMGKFYRKSRWRETI